MVNNDWKVDSQSNVMQNTRLINTQTAILATYRDFAIMFLHK